MILLASWVAGLIAPNERYLSGAIHGAGGTVGLASNHCFRYGIDLDDFIPHLA